MIRILFVTLFAMVLMASCKTQNKDKYNMPANVQIKENSEGQYRFFVNDEEFYINGAGCEGGNLEALAANGGNAFRTWMDQDGRPAEIDILNDAQKNNLKVLMGVSVGRERHGHDYDDEAWVAQQRDSIINVVKRYKDHPALLGWIIGNEINLGADNLKVYDAVNDISKIIHEIDGNHPTTFTLAGIGKRESDYIEENCNDVDFLCIQMYGDIVNLQKRISDAGYDGPYLVTEWGATGHWEVARTEWDVAIEQTSQEKATAFIERYNVAIKADPINCMGSCVFLWGQKQERTPTWYGMFLENGAKTETVDAMHKIWNGTWPEDRCPAIDSVLMQGKTAYQNVKVKSGQQFTAEVFSTTYNNDSLTFTWQIMHETTDHGWGGDFENRPQMVFNKKLDSEISVNAPEEKGAYRLFIYVSDAQGNAATANIPFLIE